MGEVVVSCEERMNVVVEKQERENEEENMNIDGSGSSMVRWERFLPRMALRVLLVEADDSTRQIIGALLRKCSYKVASVPDGLKAWEVLKARPHSIDLILTEVELPLISGYALLTLIMEHEICKNIPVIMMSVHDSVSTVYNCMLRGAVDFLVKPIRINELKNLWQHVWRRHSLSIGGSGPQDESVAQEKLEATAENNASSDRSCCSKACAAGQEPCVKKGSDAQSSCGKQGLEAESSYMAADEDHTHPILRKSPVSELRTPLENNNGANSGQRIHTPESAVEVFASATDTTAFNDNGTLDQQPCGRNAFLSAEASGPREILVDSSRQAIDFIGALDRNNSRSNDRANNCDSAPQLDLSLRRFHPGILENNPACEKQPLNHSNASAFTRFVGKTFPIMNSNSSPLSAPTEDKVNAGDHFSSENADGSNSNSQEPLLPHDGKTISLPMNLNKEVENEYINASQRLFPIPFPVRGIRVDVCSTPAGFGSIVPPMGCSPSPSLSPSSANQQISSFHQLYRPLDQSPRVSSSHAINKKDQNLEPSEDRAHFSLAADQSATSSLCNNNGYVHGSNPDAHQDGLVPGGSDNGNEHARAPHELSRQRSLQREAALNKFRLKRKERCYEKKVRYESRKKLAEQRPRVKGQFVRQVPPDPPPVKSDHSGGTSVAN